MGFKDSNLGFNLFLRIVPMTGPHPDPNSGFQPFDPESGRSAKESGVLDRALALVEFLRRECPWDAAQTSLTLIPHLLEETHEVVDAIRAEDAGALEGELGDLLLNLAFQVVVGEEEGLFTRESVAERLQKKMMRRHPHLFGLGEKEGWETLKARERLAAGQETGQPKGERERGEKREGGHSNAENGAEGTGSAAPLPETGRVLDGLPSGLDPLLKAHRIQERVSGVGFDWSDAQGAWDKVAEELEEVRDALEKGREEEVEEELGDLLFSVVNLTRLAGTHSDRVLDGANRKFRRRFEALEDLAGERGISLLEAPLEVLDGLWEELKAGRKNPSP